MAPGLRVVNPKIWGGLVGLGITLGIVWYLLRPSVKAQFIKPAASDKQAP